MLPSPSLGPPLLSASWSPPLSCGMGFAVWAGAVAGGAAGVVTAAWLGGASWCRDELPDGVGAGAAEPEAVSGPFTGGQAAAQAPLQSDFVMVSGANEYTAKPLASVSAVAPPIVAVFRLPAVAAAGLLVLVLPPPLVEDVPDEPHAASTAAAAATAGRASSIRRRSGASS